MKWAWAVGRLLDHGAHADAAERLLSAVLEAGKRLAAHPQLGRRQPEMVPDPFQFWSLPRIGLLIVYDAASTRAIILRVVHTAQDLGPLLVDLPDQSEPD